MRSGILRGQRTMRGVAAVATLASALALGGCDWRLETPEPSWATAAPDERVRNDVAVALADLVAALDGARPANSGSPTVNVAGLTGDALLIAFEDSAAAAQLDALGGVYVAYPDATPSDAPQDRPLLSVEAAAAAVRDTAFAASREAEDPGLALLLASIGLSQAVALERAAYTELQARWDSANVVEEPAPGEAQADPRFGLSPEELEEGAPARASEWNLVGSESPLPPAGSLAALEAAGLSASTMDAVIEGHDRANYAYEVLRARFGPRVFRSAARDAQAIHWKRAESLVAAAGRDPRTAGYAIDPAAWADADTMHALAVSLELELAQAYLAAYAEAIATSPEARAEAAWLLAGAYDAFMRGYAWWSGDARPLEVFPGVAVTPAG